MASKIWEQFSKEISEVVASAGKSIVAIEARAGHTSSGIVWKRDSVLTAAHAIRSESNIHVIHASGRSLSGRLAGLDRRSDLAVIQLDHELEMEPAPLADEAVQLSVGEFVVAIARTRRGNLVASSGILSGLMENFIRPDLTLYPGFSGGALLNATGTVLGMNTTAILRGKPFTLPSSNVTRIAEELAAKGHLPRPYIGVIMQPVQVPGLLVMHVEPGGPAATAGVLLGDLILGAEGHSFEDLDDFQKLLVRKGVGQSLQLSLNRGGQPLELAIRIGERPAR